MLRACLAFLFVGVLSGCALFAPPPDPTSLGDRLDAFPTEGLDLERTVTIRWNAHQVPFVEAETDADAAYALGLVHAHLRLGQMEILKRISQGRLSEMAGPLTTEIDVALRAVGYGRASAAVLDGMPPDSRAWLDRYVAGVNAYKAHAEETGLPHEFTVLGLENEPWTATDTITLGRLTGTDVNWIVLFGLMPYAGTPEFDDAVRFMIDAGQGMPPRPTELVAGRENPLARMAHLTAGLARSGSNSLVVDGTRSASGAPMIANDPHLGFTIPNPWLIGGLSSPSHEVTGMMVPGIPVFGFGRNRTLAWGGTNLRSLNTDLVDVSDLPPEAFTTETHAISNRFWFDSTATNRVSPVGPVVSDASDVPLYDGKSFALRWIGHAPSDEITALLGAMKAPNWEAFRAAMSGFALPAQNFLVADAEGTIGHMIATHIPNRPADSLYDPIVVSPARSNTMWEDILTADGLPVMVNPPEGFLASSNNRPFEGGPLLGRFFSPDERVRRLRDLAAADDAITLETLGDWQRDVYSPLSAELRDTLLARIGASDDPVVAALAGWDARYTIDSSGAAVFEAFVTGFSEAAYGAGDPEAGVIAALVDRGFARPMVLNDAPRLDADAWSRAFQAGLDRARPLIEDGTVWGDIHRLNIQHVLGNAPLIGGAYRNGDTPIPGSRETVFKTSHDMTAERHSTTFGSQSRHLSDLADPDANFYVLFGGQDGWINSATALDQVAMFLEGEYIQVPLTEAARREAFPIVMDLTR